MPLLSRLAIVVAASARATTSIEAKASVHDALAAVIAPSPFHEIRIARVCGTLAPVGHYLTAVFSAAVIIRGHVV